VNDWLVKVSVVRVIIGVDMTNPNVTMNTIYVNGKREKQVAWYSSIGGYPIIYLTDKDEVMCPGCAGRTIENVTSHIYEEGHPVECSECSLEIESAYGVPTYEICRAEVDQTGNYELQHFGIDPETVEAVIETVVYVNQSTYACSATALVWVFPLYTTVKFKDGSEDQLENSQFDQEPYYISKRTHDYEVLCEVETNLVPAFTSGDEILDFVDEQ
jgi:hypothetical protein